MSGDTFVPQPERESFMRRLNWSRTQSGTLRTEILDTSVPEYLFIIPLYDNTFRVTDDDQKVVGYKLVINRGPVGGVPSQTLATADTEEELQEYARRMVGDPQS